MAKPIRNLSGLSTAIAALAVGAAAPLIWADEFDEAEIFFELNDTDRDLGIHALIDGDAWKKLKIRDPDGHKLLDVEAKGGIRKQGLTEFFFESAEPTFDELSPTEFFERFPEGEYEIEGKTLEGEELESETMVTHLLPAPPDTTLTVDGMEFEGCEGDGEFPEDPDNVVISWDPITMSHSGLGVDVAEVTIVNYEVVVEVENEEIDTVFKVSAVLPPTATSFRVPDEIIALGVALAEDEMVGVMKYEVLVREESFNQTATEVCMLEVEEEEE